MTTTDSIERFRAEFLELRSARQNEEPGWLTLVRTQALERFLDKGFPTLHDEEWRFTNVAPIASGSFALPSAASGSASDAASLKERFRIDGQESHDLVFVNGHWSRALSSVGELPPGVILTSLTTALAERPDEVQRILSEGAGDDTPFFDLNEAFLSDGAYVYVPKGVVIERPIHLVFLSRVPETPMVVHPRNVIVAEAGSHVRLLETYAGVDDEVYWTNAVTQVSAADNAVIDHYKLQRESGSAFHVASLEYVQGRSASVSNHSLSLGARLSRHDIRSQLSGEGADVTLNGLYVVKGSQHVDHHTLIDHQVPHCTSRELYKGVLDDRSSGVFNGRVIVRKDAQKTDSRQSNKNLLLSKEALVNTNPQLEINADDVKCAHGATIGQLDAEALFYLRSRGIARQDAQKILTEGFMADVSNRIRLAPVRETLRGLLFHEAA